MIFPILSRMAMEINCFGMPECRLLKFCSTIFLFAINLWILVIATCFGVQAQNAFDNSVINPDSSIESMIRRHLEVGHLLYKKGNDRGISYQACMEYELALSEYSKAIALNPRLPEAYNSRGNVYRNSGLYDTAMNDFNKAIELDSMQADFFNQSWVNTWPD